MKKGDRVSVLDENISGVVKSVNHNMVVIETTDGFDLNYAINELIVLDGAISNRELAEMDVHSVLFEKEFSRKRKSTSKGLKRKKIPAMEVDLHIHQLVENSNRLSNYEILNIQLEEAKRQLEYAIKKRRQSVVFIHGVGEGVLREELYTLFRRYDNIDFFDADYQKYGIGATEIYIFQNPKS